MSGEKKVDSKRKSNETRNAEPEEEMPGPRQETPSTTAADADIEAEFEKIFRELANTKIEGMPELTKLLLDDEVMDLYEDPDTINDLANDQHRSGEHRQVERQEGDQTSHGKG